MSQVLNPLSIKTVDRPIKTVIIPNNPKSSGDRILAKMTPVTKRIPELNKLSAKFHAKPWMDLVFREDIYMILN
jgi:hypothetical protein